jgi:hypothetical protein
MKQLTRIEIAASVALAGVLAVGTWLQGFGAAAQAHLDAVSGLARAPQAIGPHPLLEWAGRAAQAIVPGAGGLALLNALSLVALVWMVGWLGRALGGRLAGWMAALMCVLHPDIAAAMSGPGPTIPLAALMVAQGVWLTSERLGWRRWPLVGLGGAVLVGSMLYAAPWWLLVLLVWLLVRADGDESKAVRLPVGMVGAVGLAALVPLVHPGMRAAGLKAGWHALLVESLAPAAEAARFGEGWFGDVARLPAWAGLVRAVADWPLVCTAGVVCGLWALGRARSRRGAWVVGVTLGAGLLLPWISGSWLVGRAEIAALVAPWAAVMWGQGAAWCLRGVYQRVAEQDRVRGAQAVALCGVLVACGLGAELMQRMPWSQGGVLARAARVWPLRLGHIPRGLAQEVVRGEGERVLVLGVAPQVLGWLWQGARFVATPAEADVIVMPGWEVGARAWPGWSAEALGPGGAPAWWVMRRER